MNRLAHVCEEVGKLIQTRRSSRLGSARIARHTLRPGLACEHLRRALWGQWFVTHRLEGDQTVQQPEELPHVVNLDSRCSCKDAFAERHVMPLGPPYENSKPGLIVGLSDVNHQAAVESRSEFTVQIFDLRRWAIARQHNLFLSGLELRREAEELRLHLAPMRQELDVVH